jgi:hypothetical protein
LARSASRSKAGSAAAILVAAALFFASGCDKGLAPIYEESGFAGVIHYKNWPPADQVRELRLLVFEKVPLDSTRLVDALLGALLDPGHIVLYPPVGTTGLPKFVDTTHYKLITAGSTLLVQQYNYVVLAQRYGPNSFADWKPAGVYTLNQVTLEPAPVRLRPRRLLENIDIYVDFNRPPPKPWR